MKLITEEFKESFIDYPLYSQESSDDPIVIIKLHIPYTNICWFLLEYNPEDRIAFSFVQGLAEDEFGYVSLLELELLELENGISVVLDSSFKQQRLSECSSFNRKE